jgi:uncharacterized membrane protein SirB2
MVFGETIGEKVVCVLVAVLSWLIIGRVIRSGKQNYVAFIEVLGCFAVFVYIAYLTLRIHGQ